MLPWRAVSNRCGTLQPSSNNFPEILIGFVKLLESTMFPSFRAAKRANIQNDSGAYSFLLILGFKCKKADALKKVSAPSPN